MTNPRSSDRVICRDITETPIARDFHEIMVQIRCWGQPDRLGHNRGRASTIIEVAQYGSFAEEMPDNAVVILDGHPIKIIASFERCHVPCDRIWQSGDAYIIKSSESGFVYTMYVYLIEDRFLFKIGKQWNGIITASMRNRFIPAYQQ